MTDVTTKLIYGTFIQNRPDKVGEQEAEELFNHWLEVHGFQPEEQPIAPAGFEYETVKTKEDSTPSSDDLDVIALASDNATNSASMISDVMDSLPESTREALACALNDFDCAAEHLHTFCRTVRRVAGAGKVKWYSHGAEGKPSLKWA